jgi:hypothetical protein
MSFDELGDHPDRVAVRVVVGPDLEGVIEAEFSPAVLSYPTSKTGLPTPYLALLGPSLGVALSTRAPNRTGLSRLLGRALPRRAYGALATVRPKTLPCGVEAL